MRDLDIDRSYLQRLLKTLLATPSPSGMTDEVVSLVCVELGEMGIPFELTRRGAIRADLAGTISSPDRAIVAHLDTLGAMVKGFRENGRLELVAIGHWSARFAEGARGTVYADGGRTYRGTILPLKASGHTYGDAVDTQPGDWKNVEFRLDERTGSPDETRALHINVGDTVAVDPATEFTRDGFVVSRHLDDKAGVAAMLAAVKEIRKNDVPLPMDAHLVFTVNEEVGVGASHALHGDVAELVAIDNGTIAPGQYTSEFGVTVAMQDSAGPFDWHLTRSLLEICDSHGIEHSRDVFNDYRSDAAAALEAGNDIRTALICFGLDASHGWERVHLDSVVALGRLLGLYMQSKPLFARDEEVMGPRGDLPESNIEPEAAE